MSQPQVIQTFSMFYLCRFVQNIAETSLETVQNEPTQDNGSRLTKSEAFIFENACKSTT